MHRKLITHFNNWINQEERVPLVLRGARQVGKSYLVREVAKLHNKEIVEINFDKQKRLNSLFLEKDIPYIISTLETYFKKEIDDNKSLLFLDEIQAAPEVLSSLRYFFEERPNLPVVAAGSLLDFELENHSFSMPVGRIEYLHLYPMSFDEYLLAANEQKLLESMQNFDFSKPFPEVLHLKLIKHFRTFLLLGGMPAVLNKHFAGQSERSIKAAQQGLIDTYADDLSKYPTRNPKHLKSIYSSLPSHIGKKIKFSQVNADIPAREQRAVFGMMSLARIVYRAFNNSSDRIPLEAGKDENIFKIYWMDVGLLNRMLRLDWHTQFLEQSEFWQEGYVAEQFIAQHLVDISNGLEQPNLNYWLRERKNENAEVDFVFQCGDKIIPIEVKSGAAGSMKSMLQFAFEKNCKRGVRFDINPPSRQKVSFQLHKDGKSTPVEYELISLPHYMVNEIYRLVLR